MLTADSPLIPATAPPDRPDHPLDTSNGGLRAARSRPISARILLLPLQLFLVAGWARAGIEKVIDPDWWSGAGLLQFLDDQRDHMLPFFLPFADHVVTPLAPVVAWLVLWMQLTIAVCLLANRHVRPALWAGVLLNLCFTMAGRVNPSAFYLVMQLTLLVALSRPVPLQIALRRAALWLVPATLVLPFARTIQPAEVIDDPALMISFVAVLAAVSTVAIVNRPAQLLDVVSSTSLGRWGLGHVGRFVPTIGADRDPQDVNSSGAARSGTTPSRLPR